MKNPLTKLSSSKEVAPASDGANPFLEMVERVASNPEIDADKIQKILDMQIQVMDREARDEFYAAMNRVQGNLPAVIANCENSQTSSRYADHKALAKAIKPVYTKEGFSLSFSEGKSEREDYIRIDGKLRHSAGHSEDYSTEIPLDLAGIRGSTNKTRTHATGSSLSYGRRYLTLLVFDVATGDDNDAQYVTEYVTNEQADIIQGLLEQLPVSVQNGFFKWALSLQELTGEETPSDLAAAYFDDYVGNLKKKIEKHNATD